MKYLSTCFDNFQFLTDIQKFQSPDDTRKIESCQNKLKDTSFNAVFYAESEKKFYLKFELRAPYVHFLLFYKRFKTAGSRSSKKEEMKHILIYFALFGPEIFMDFFP
jgi:hypothetical protein